MARDMKRRPARERMPGYPQEEAGAGPQQKPGSPAKRAAKGGRNATARSRTAPAGAAKKGAGKGTDRSRHRSGGKKKTRATSRSPSLG